MKYRHEDRAEKLIKELSCKEEGIMWAEMAAAKLDRDYEKFARKMAELKNSMDIATRRNAAKREGLAEGRAEGRAEGLAEGLADGLEKGRAEEKLEIAQKMKKAGLPFNEIMEFTGLPTETIEKI